MTSSLPLLRILLLSIISILPISAFCQASCDKRRSCNDRSIVFDRPSGNSRSHVFVDYRPFLEDLRGGFTFEAKIKMKGAPGQRSYLAGIWGPNEEDNDCWVLYVDEVGNLVFELEHPVKLGQGANRDEDNTRATVGAFSQYYDNWTHVAAVFDPSTNEARIYINGEPAAVNNNALYPLDQLSSPQNKGLGMLIGSANKVTGPEGYRSFEGEMDEIKIWSVPQSDDFIACHFNLSHSMNTANLLLYYRANDEPNSYSLCDATNNGFTGSLRDARITNGSFPQPRPFKIYEAPTFPDTLRCITNKRYRIVIEDTSACASGLSIQARTWERNLDNTNWMNMNSSDLVPVDNSWRPISDGILEYEFEINADWVGTKRYLIRLQRNNSCGWQAYQDANVYITRITDVELDVGNDTLDYGILSSYCESEQRVSDFITISNNSDVTGTNRTLNVLNVDTQDPNWRVVTPVPFSVPMGQSRQLEIEFLNPNVAGTYMTDFIVTTDDQCSDGVYTIPAQAEVEDVFQLSSRAGDPILAHDFGVVCLGRISRALTFFLENLSSRDIKLLSVTYPNGYVTRIDQGLPKDLPANRSFSDEYIYLQPQTEGNFDGELILRVETENGCIIRYPVALTGSGVNPDFEFTVTNVDYGDVVVGQEGTMSVELRNKSTLPLTLNLALNKSEVYFFAGANRITLAPNATRSIDIDFRPTDAEVYPDKLVAWETACNNTYTVDITGRGILDQLTFNPEITRVDDVLGCSTESMEGEIENISSSPITLSNFELIDPNGRFTIDRINSTQNPNLNNFTLDLDGGEKLSYTLSYSPNDLTVERGDRAFLAFEDANGNEWSAKLYGTSRLPRLYVSNNGQFGTREVGEVITRTLYVENVSTQGEVTLDSIFLSRGNQDLQILYPSTAELRGRTLAVGDTVEILVQFSPQSPLSFNDTINITSDAPCSVVGSEPISGFGRTYPLELGIRDLAMGYAAPCDCQSKEFYLDNESEEFPISIDEIAWDDSGLSYPSSEYYSWSSKYSPGGLSPYQIPPDTRDTVTLLYCPRQDPDRDSINNETNFILSASGTGWGPDTFNIYLIGKRKLLFEPSPDTTNFPPTRVDTLSQPQVAYLKVPSEIELNPDNTAIRVDSITFFPDDRVFTASDSLGRSFPIYVSSLDSLNIKVDFYPRAPRLYEAKMLLHISEPCSTIDSTLYVNGLGFAPAFGLAFHIEEASKNIDTLVVAECDTLRVPFYSSRGIPATVSDISFLLHYDKSKLNFLGLESEYLLPENACSGFPPSYQTLAEADTADLMKVINFCSVDSLKPVFTALFYPTGIVRDTSIIRIDSIEFDTQDVILYNVLAENDEAAVAILDVGYALSAPIDFPPTQVLDCADTSFTIYNTGQVPLSMRDLYGYSLDTLAVTSIASLSDTIAPGDSMLVSLRFCPRAPDSLSNRLFTESYGCGLLDSLLITGVGYAPDFELYAGTLPSFTAPDTVYGQIGEEIEITVELDKDIAIEFDSVTYRMAGVSFDMDIQWNPFALRLLEFTPAPNINVSERQNLKSAAGILPLSFVGMPQVDAGPVGTIKFLVTVPDVQESPISFRSHSFTSDDILFYNMLATENDITFSSSQSCSISTLHYSFDATSLSAVTPNPAASSAELRYTVGESLPVYLHIYDVAGNLVRAIHDGETLPIGPRTATLDLSGLTPGVYFYTLRLGRFSQQRSLNIIR